ncbi:hypothetical protein [Streptobacillus moniliformis]|uniref:hypothetical protein n=1 Tax=Streptobacillus moniliformis TaxID=34105 RepID=UPI0007E3C1AE|nr:hypothetical protein [Streptobacillus moniliformis]
MEESIKEGLKLRGLWDRRYEEDDEARKEFYHSQGLRLKDEQILASGLIDLTYDNTKSKIGLIYTTKDLDNLTGRVEGFANVRQSVKDILDIYVNVNYKLKPDISKRLGRLKGDITLSKKIGNVDLKGKAYGYLGTVLISDRDRKVGIEGTLLYNKDKINIKSVIKHDTIFDYSKNKQTNKESKTDSTESYFHNQELLFDLGYKSNRIEVKTENKIRGKVFTKSLAIDKDKYKSSDTNKDKTVLTLYTSNKLVRSFGNLGLSLDARYRAGLDYKDSGSVTDEHISLLGLGINYKGTNTKNSIDTAFIAGYVDSKELYILNVWSDNSIDYRMNNKLRLIGELNLTSSNRLGMLYQGQETEILGLGDISGRIEYRPTDRVEIINEVGTKAILLFNYNDRKKAQPKTSSSTTNNNSMSDKLQKLHLHTQYQYKVYSDNSVSYKINDGIRLIGKLGLSYLNGYDSERLYTALRDIKRKQIGENGILEISSKDTKKIKEEKQSYGEDNLSKILINPRIELELRFMEDKLLLKPRGEVIVSIANKENENFKYKKTTLKLGLNVDYKW